MKFVKGISLFFVYPVILLLTGMYAGIVWERYFYPGKEISPETTSISSENVPASEENVPVSESASVPESAVLVLSSEEVIKTDTEYIIQEYDTRRDTLIEKQVSIPVKYLGMNREEFIAAMELYALSPPLSEQKRGFMGLEVRSFSSLKVVVCMHYAYVEPTSSFYIKVEDNQIVVYCEDNETIYMYTGIEAVSLPEYLQTQVSMGMQIENEENLYYFLETYSS